MEYVCDAEENQKREDDGLLGDGYSCVQQRTHRTVYRDTQDRPVEVQVAYNAGCEVRCSDPDCKLPHGTLVNNNGTQSADGEVVADSDADTDAKSDSDADTDAKSDTDAKDDSADTIAMVGADGHEKQIKIKNFCHRFGKMAQVFCKAVVSFD